MPLLDHHQRHLGASGISYLVAEARGYDSVEDPRRLRELGFSVAQARVPGILMPLWGVTGQRTGWSYRPDAPRVNTRNRAVKYEYPQGAPMMVDVPPGLADACRSPSTPLWITEGIKKSDAGVSCGLAAIVAIFGVYCWRGRNQYAGLSALGDWESLALNGREVRIAFDSDAVTKPDVRRAGNRLGAFLRSRGARVRYANLPPLEPRTPDDAPRKCGLDDFLLENTVEQLEATLADEIAPEPIPDAAPGVPRIEVTTLIQDMTELADRSLADSQIFHRGGRLVRALWVTGDDGADRFAVQELPNASLTAALSASATWWKNSGEHRLPAEPPERVVRALESQGAWDHVRRISGVADRPILRADGTICAQNGYDAASATWIQTRSDFPEIPETPTLEQAQAASMMLKMHARDFPFVEDYDRTAWLALVLTLLGRSVFGWPAPCFAVTARVQESGKSHLVNMAGIIADGADVPRRAPPVTEEEEFKIMGAVRASGDTAALFDNLVRRWGSAQLATWQDSTGPIKVRELGVGREPPMMLPFMIVTGNNLSLTSDMPSRLVQIAIDPQCERPGDRPMAAFAEPDIIGATHRRRPELLVAALTVWRWWFAAGRPLPSPALPSCRFTTWSRTVRACLWVLGEGDCWAGQARIRASGADDAVDAVNEMIELWADKLPPVGYTTPELVLKANGSDLGEALAALDPGSGRRKGLDGSDLNVTQLRKALQRIEGRVHGRFKLQGDASPGARRVWRLVEI